jgi:hypothetical protein
MKNKISKLLDVGKSDEEEEKEGGKSRREAELKIEKENKQENENDGKKGWRYLRDFVLEYFSILDLDLLW